jgi:hypothetical protein
MIPSPAHIPTILAIESNSWGPGQQGCLASPSVSIYSLHVASLAGCTQDNGTLYLVIQVSKDSYPKKENQAMAVLSFIILASVT